MFVNEKLENKIMMKSSGKDILLTKNHSSKKQSIVKHEQGHEKPQNPIPNDEHSTNMNSTKIKMATKIFMDSKYGMMDDLNVEFNALNHHTPGQVGMDHIEPPDLQQKIRNSPILSDKHSTFSNESVDLRDNQQHHYHHTILSKKTPIISPKFHGQMIFSSDKETTVSNKRVTSTSSNFSSTFNNTNTLIPKSTRANSEKARIYLEHYYNFIIKSISLEGLEYVHENIDGVYNPLQIIRNRRSRKKQLNESLSTGLFLPKTPLIAVKEFSKNEKYTTPWFVDISEKEIDKIWRNSHWEELTDRKGRFWFGTNPSRRSKTSLSTSNNSVGKSPRKNQNSISSAADSSKKSDTEGHTPTPIPKISITSDADPQTPDNNNDKPEHNTDTHIPKSKTAGYYRSYSDTNPSSASASKPSSASVSPNHTGNRSQSHSYVYQNENSSGELGNSENPSTLNKFEKLMLPRSPWSPNDKRKKSRTSSTLLGKKKSGFFKLQQQQISQGNVGIQQQKTYSSYADSYNSESYDDEDNPDIYDNEVKINRSPSSKALNRKASRNGLKQPNSKKNHKIFSLDVGYKSKNKANQPSSSSINMNRSNKHGGSSTSASYKSSATPMPPLIRVNSGFDDNDSYSESEEVVEFVDSNSKGGYYTEEDNDNEPFRRRKNRYQKMKDAIKGRRPAAINGVENSSRELELNYKHPEQLELDERLQKNWRETRYIKGTVHLMQNRRLVFSKIKEKELNKRNNAPIILVEGDLFKDTNEALDLYNMRLEKVIRDANSWNSKWLNDYSVRVQTLVIMTDRIMTDINTTLTLKLKLFQEKAEKYESLKNLQAQRMSKILYRCLEYLLIVMFTLVRTFVKGLKEIKRCIIIFFKLLAWLI